VAATGVEDLGVDDRAMVAPPEQSTAQSPPTNTRDAGPVKGEDRHAFDFGMRGCYNATEATARLRRR